jgi:hypothetical protein
MTPNKTQPVQHDLNQMLDQCTAMFAEAVKQERGHVDKLTSTFLMMRDMGYTPEEAKAEFVRFQAEFNADTSKQSDTSGCSLVNVRRRHQAVASSPGYEVSRRHGLTGSQRFGRVFTLCLVVIPILFFVGVLAEIWFGYNPWGRACFYVRYVKAALYIGVWYSLMTACLPRIMANALITFFVFAGVGLSVSHETVVDAWGVAVYGETLWINFWLNTECYYWGLLTLTYVYAWCKLARGPRHWIMQYGVS